MPLQLRPLLEQLSIKTKKAEIRKYDLNFIDPDEGDLGWAQRPFIAEIERQYNQGRPVRIIVLKARQLGISTATEAVLFWWAFLHPGSNSLVLSHEDTQSQELFAMTKLYWDTWPHKSLYSSRYATRRQLSWKETLSQIRVATAKNEESGRGSTLQGLHASEVAYWPNPEGLWSNLDQSISQHEKSIVVLESTANGVGNWFYDMWQRAEEGETDYIPMFFPWYKHPEYHHTTYKASTRLELNPEEKHLYRLMSEEGFDDEYIYGSVSWRKWKILNSYNGDVERFMEGYPSYPEEAFITSGKPIFPWRSLHECLVEQPGLRGYCHRDPTGRVRFVSDPSGDLTVFKRPNRDGRGDQYFVAGDPSESIAGDPACIQVINRGTLEQVAVWHGRIDPVNFADEMMLIGDLFNHAMICPEVEGGGQATMGRILSVGYNNVWLHKTADRLKGSFNVFGWSTNYQRKHWCIGFLKRLIMDQSLVLHDRHTYHQLRNYVQHPNGEWGNAAGSHDDAVMALAIAVTASDKEGPYVPEAIRGSQPILDIYNQQTEELYSNNIDIYEGVN
jgi:hypothetical protein